MKEICELSEIFAKKQNDNFIDYNFQRNTKEKIISIQADLQ